MRPKDFSPVLVSWLISGLRPDPFTHLVILPYPVLKIKPQTACFRTSTFKLVSQNCLLAKLVKFPGDSTLYKGDIKWCQSAPHQVSYEYDYLVSVSAVSNPFTMLYFVQGFG